MNTESTRMPKNVLKQFIPDRFQKLKRSASNHNCDEEIFPRRRVVVKRETKSLILDRISDEEDESDLVVVKEMPSICEESEDDERIMEYGSDSSRKSNALRNFFRDHFIKTNKISSSSIDDFNNQKNLRRTLSCISNFNNEDLNAVEKMPDISEECDEDFYSAEKENS